MRSSLVATLTAALMISSCSTSFPTDIRLAQGDVGCEVEHADQRWTVGPIPDGGSVVIEPDASALITVQRVKDELTINALRGSEGGETVMPVSSLNGNWDPEDWMFIDGDGFRPTAVRCWQQP